MEQSHHDGYDRQQKDDRNSFLEWAKSNVTPLKLDPNDANTGKDDNNADLDAIAREIGDAKIVALSEGCHNSKEMMMLHHRIVRYLVTHHGFDTVVTETGLPESRFLFDYVQGREVEDDCDIIKDNFRSVVKDNSDTFQDIKDGMYKKGLNKMYGEWKEGRELIEWMREYNINMKQQCERMQTIMGDDTDDVSNDNKEQDTNTYELQYYGVDIGGFYDDWKTPLQARVIDYLEKYDVDLKYAKELSMRFEPFLKSMNTNARVYYHECMTPRERSELALLLDEAVEHFHKMESLYVARSSKFEFEWARQSLVSMQLAENYYRNYLDRSSSKSGERNTTSKCVGLIGREIAMFQNIQWVMEQRKLCTRTSCSTSNARQSKIIWINHVIHTKTETQYQDAIWGFFSPAGQLLRQKFADELYVIGLIYSEGSYWKHWQKPKERVIAPVPPPRADGIEKLMSEVVRIETVTMDKENSNVFFIPWSQALGISPLLMKKEFSMRENDYYIKIKPKEWNACIFLHRTSPATPAS